MGWRKAVTALAFAFVALPLAASSAAAQTYGFLSFGNAASSDDPFCEDPTALITMIAAGVSTPLFGATVEYNNGDYPWPPMEESTGEFLTHGAALQLMASVNPAQFVARGLSQYVRPFVGVGLHIGSDGETRTGTVPTNAVLGQTRPFIAYGANAILPIGSRLGVTAGYRGTSVLFGDFEIDTPGGATETIGGKTLTAHSLNVGFLVRLGS